MGLALLNPTCEELADAFLDITAPQMAEVQIRSDGQVLWVNVDGICVLRVCRIPAFELNDARDIGEKIVNDQVLDALDRRAHREHDVDA